MRLRADRIEVIDVPAKLASRVRLLSTGHGRKNDDADAISVGIAALTSRTLNSADIDSTTRALRAVIEHRDDLVKTRNPNHQPTPCRAHPPDPRGRRTQVDRRPRR
jgi:transposase